MPGSGDTLLSLPPGALQCVSLLPSPFRSMILPGDFRVGPARCHGGLQCPDLGCLLPAHVALPGWGPAVAVGFPQRTLSAEEASVSSWQRVLLSAEGTLHEVGGWCFCWLMVEGGKALPLGGSFWPWHSSRPIGPEHYPLVWMRDPVPCW